MMLQTCFAIFYFIAGDTQLLNCFPFTIILNLQLISVFPSLTTENRNHSGIVPYFSYILQNPSVGIQPFTRELFFSSSIAFQPFLWNFLLLLSQ